MRLTSVILAFLLAVYGPSGGAYAQSGAAGAQVVQTSVPADGPAAAEEEPAGGSAPHPAVWIAIGVVVGLVILIAAISEGGVGFPDTDPSYVN